MKFGQKMLKNVKKKQPKIHFLEYIFKHFWQRIVFSLCQAQVQVQVPGQVQKVKGLRTKDLDLG